METFAFALIVFDSEGDREREGRRREDGRGRGGGSGEGVGHRGRKGEGGVGENELDDPSGERPDHFDTHVTQIAFRFGKEKRIFCGTIRSGGAGVRKILDLENR